MKKLIPIAILSLLSTTAFANTVELTCTFNDADRTQRIYNTTVNERTNSAAVVVSSIVVPVSNGNTLIVADVQFSPSTITIKTIGDTNQTLTIDRNTMTITQSVPAWNDPSTNSVGFCQISAITGDRTF